MGISESCCDAKHVREYVMVDVDEKWKGKNARNLVLPFMSDTFLPKPDNNMMEELKGKGFIFDQAYEYPMKFSFYWNDFNHLKQVCEETVQMIKVKIPD